ncbi:MAG: LysE family transporter [Pseudomonadota bacterium]
MTPGLEPALTLDWALPALIAFFVAAASPGPATLGVAATAMSRGARAGCWFGAGLALGLAIWGVVAAAGLGALLQQSVWALTLLRLLGGAYLLYLALRAAGSALGPEASRAEDGAANGRFFRRGLLLNAANPKAVLAWLAVLAIGLPDGADSASITVLTALCAIAGLAIYLGYALAFSRRSVMAGYRRARRGIDGAVAAAFSYAGIRLLTTRTEMP